MKNLVAQQQSVRALGLGDLPEHRRAAHGLLGDALAGKTDGTLIGRVANSEGSVARLYSAKKTYDARRRSASLNAGISPPTDAVLNAFSQRYLDAIRAADLMTLPFYSGFSDWLDEAKTFVSDGTPWFSYDILRNPFGEEDPDAHWIRGLDGRRVAVVTPFRASIEYQLDRLDAVYAKMPGLKPQWKSLTIVDAPLTQWDNQSSDAQRPAKTWLEHFERLTNDIADQCDGFDVCLLGCGGYGMPAAHFVKSELDRVALVFGGALQLLFGIRGFRWDQRSPVSRWMNDAWIRPAPSERPDCWEQIDRGAYW